MKKAIKYIFIIVLLVFVTGCADNSSVIDVKQSQAIRLRAYCDMKKRYLIKCRPKIQEPVLVSGTGKSPTIWQTMGIDVLDNLTIETEPDTLWKIDLVDSKGHTNTCFAMRTDAEQLDENQIYTFEVVPVIKNNSAFQSIFKESVYILAIYHEGEIIYDRRPPEKLL